MTNNIKPFFAYAGGKSTMAADILPLIPKHVCYVEPFFGSGVIFWKKEQAKVSVINDINHEVVNFWRIVGTRLDDLLAELKLTLYSRYEFERATKIRKACKEYNELQRAWAFFVSQNQGFAGNFEARRFKPTLGTSKEGRQLGAYFGKIENIEELKELIKEKLEGCEYSDLEQAWAFFVSQNQGFSGKDAESWGFGKTEAAKGLNDAFYNRIENIEEFIEVIKTRVKKTFIECRPATKVIQQFDGPDTFHFLDPPYVNTEQTQYKGNEYTQEDLIELLELCEKLEGRFMLTHYDNETIREYANKNNWTIKEVVRTSSVANAKAGSKARPKKTEMIVMNYTVYDDKNTLF